MNKPKKIKSIWDNEGETLDRYVIVLKEKKGWSDDYYPCIYSCHQPASPQGVSGWSDVGEGEHLGKRINWADLPENVQEFVINQLK